MASNDKLWFDVGVRDNVTKVLESIIGKANDLQKALSITGKDPLIPGIKESYDNVSKLEIAIEKIRGAIRSVRTVRMSVTDPKDIANLNKMQSELEKMRSRVKAFMDEVKKNPDSITNKGLAESFLSSLGFDTAITQATNRVKDYEVAQKNSTRATKESAQVNESLIRTYNEISNSGKNVNVILTQMQNQIASFTSLYGIERLLKSVITIGGQFEFQHIALQNILGDVQQANTLFGQLQTLAIESPKTFMELTSYTKQLSAYQIPYEELFDTTKRLADLSTGLGVDMSRLILAYGQVRSAAVLRGQELRQFTEAGIPLVQKLAEEFTKLNGRVTTTGDVFELISKRAVPFTMIKKILWDMTSEGGQFYNMQAELADTLYGKWQKLQDQWQITLGHIADGEKSSGKFLKTTLEGVVKLVSLFDTILPLFSMFAAGKMAVGIFGKGKSIYDKYTGRTAINNWQLSKEKDALRLEKERLMYGKQLTAEEQKLVRYKDQIVASDMKLLVLQGEITQKQLAQLANAGKLNKLELYRYLRAQGYTLEQWKQIKNGDLQMLKGGRGSFLGNALKGGYNMMGGWFGIAMMGIGGIMSLQENASQKVEEATNAAKGASDEMMKDLKDVNSLYNELSATAPKSAEEVSSAINRMSDSIKSSGGYTEDLQKKLEGVSDVEKYKILYNELQNISAEYLKMKENVEAYLSAANNVGEGNWFTRMFKDPMLTDLQQLSEARIAKKGAMAKANIEGAAFRVNLEEYLKSIGKWNEELFGPLKWYEIYEKLDKKAREDFRNELERNAHNGVGGNWERLAELIKPYEKAIENVISKTKEVNEQMPEAQSYWYMALQEKASLNNIVLENLGKDGKEEDIRKVNQWINDIVGSMNLDSETSQKVRNAILSVIPKDLKARIEALPALNKSNLSKWQEELQTYFNDNSLNVPIDAQTSLEKVEKQLQEKKKVFQEQMDRGKGILIRFGADFSNLEASIEALKKKYPFLSFFLDKAKEDYTEGSSGVKKVDKAGKDLGLNVNGKTKKSGSGTKSDKTLKRWQERKKALDEYYKLYQEYSQYMTREEAIKRINDTGLLPGQDLPENIDDYLAVMKKLMDEIKGQIKGTERQSFWDSLVGDYNKKDFEKNTKEQVDALLKQLDDELKKQGKQWDLYKKILDATGNKEQAAQFAFGRSTRFENYAEQLRSEISDALQKNDKAKDKTIDELLGLDDNALKEIDIFEKGVDGVYKKLKQLKDVEESLNATNTDLWLKAITNAKELDTQIALINQKYDDMRKALEKNRTAQNSEQTDKALQGLDKANREEVAKATWDNFKATEEWGRIFSNLDNITTDTLEYMLSKLSAVAPSIRESVEATKALYEAMDKIQDQLYERNPFAALGDYFSKMSAFRSFTSEYGSRLSGLKSSDKISISADRAKKMGLNTGDVDWEGTVQEFNDAMYKESKGFSKIVSGIGKTFKALQDVLQPVIDLFDQLGMTELSTIFQMGNNAFGAAASAASGISSLGGLFNEDSGIGKALGAAGPYAAAAAAGISIVSGLFALHDKALQEEIDASKARQKEMENLTKNLQTSLEYVLGGVYTFTSSMMSKKQREDFLRQANQITGKGVGSDWLSKLFYELTKGRYGDDTVANMGKAARTQEYYDMQRAGMMAQRDELRKQLAAESDKKDSDSNAIADYKQQVKEIETELNNFALDMAKSLYDIDLKSWAQELTDAIVEAWENGEDAAEAYKDKVKEIMKDLTKNILAQKIMEKAFENAGIDDLISQMMDAQSGKLDETNVGRIAEALYNVGETSSNAILAILDEMEKKGYINKGDDSASTSTSAGIKSITENTADLIASYLNAIRGDVSVNRATLDQILIAVQTGARVPVIAEAQLRELQTLVSMARERTQFVGEIRDMISRAQNGTMPISVK